MTDEELAMLAAMDRAADGLDEDNFATDAKAVRAGIAEIRRLHVALADPPGVVERLIDAAVLAERERCVNGERETHRTALVAAIRTFTVDGPNDGPNGPTEVALAAMLETHLAMLDAVLPLLDRSRHRAAFEALQVAGDAMSKYGGLIADDVQALREAADAFFGGDFRKP